MIQSVRSVASLLLSTFFLLAAMGLSGYLIPIRAVAEGWTTFSISLIATGYAIAFTASCIITPRLVLKVGHVRVFGALTTIMGMSYLLHSLVVHPGVWVLTRALAGFSIAGCYMIIESWLNEKVSNENRGALFSVYMMVSMSAVMVGQYIVPLGDPSGPTLFMVCALICSMAVMPTLLSGAHSPKPLTQVKFDVPALYKRSPAAVIGTLLAGLIASAWGGLGPVYATQLGLSTTEGASMLAIAMIGGAIFQYPLGRISDRMDRRRVMIFAGIIGILACSITVTFGVENRIIFFGGMLFLGTVLLPIYSLNVAHANDHAEPDEFVEVASGLMITYGVATMIGPLITGAAMDWFGPHALFAVIALCFAAYSAHAAWRISRREQAPEEMRSDFLPMAAMPDQTPQSAELDPRSDPGYGEQSEMEDNDTNVPA
ncbi:arabinose efflux permease family protein [Hoeflea sp. IMCC20628]|uniref:MFS transporter n=1 Tax=Hoeflea sp. IMCC20628 TaxID=1620421 RepID=UPI00063A9152|nr:MFS transporter [Hoeflea sp. IMCC20628]AKI01181.1 arabinose efflux permease family protein [Hoeflea sp. IMCC20628]